jgi:hypothetical protein
LHRNSRGWPEIVKRNRLAFLARALALDHWGEHTALADTIPGVDRLVVVIWVK